MQATIVSQKFQVVIPRKIRELFAVKPGQKVIFLPSIRLVIIPSLEEACGMLKGMDTDIERGV